MAQQVLDLFAKQSFYTVSVLVNLFSPRLLNMGSSSENKWMNPTCPVQDREYFYRIPKHINEREILRFYTISDEELQLR